MGDELRATVQRLAAPLVGYGVAVGILLGLLLGWFVWPVQWYDTDPSDQRLAHQADYVVLASDSLAVTGDVEAARQRLAELTDGDTTWHQVANLVEKVAAEREARGDLAAALRLRLMAQAAGLPLATSSEFSPRAGAGRPATLLYVAAALLGLGVAAYLYRSRLAMAALSPRPAPASWLDRAAPSSLRSASPMRPGALDLQGDEDDADLSEEAFEHAESDEELDDLLPDDAESQWEGVAPPPVVVAPHADKVAPAPREPGRVRAAARPGNGDAFLSESDADEERLDEWEHAADEEDQDLILDDEREPLEVVVPAAEPGRAVRGVVEPMEAFDLPPDALGMFEAEYILGDDDFDSSFTIESSDGEFLGECGVGMADVLDAGHGVQRADAFEVWLFDKDDIRTVTKVLVSEAAYRDEARSVRLAAKGELVIAQPGLEVVLETLSLRVMVTLHDCEFAEGNNGPEGTFTRLDLEMIAESSDAVP